jgi:hypothetical protein
MFWTVRACSSHGPWRSIRNRSRWCPPSQTETPPNFVESSAASNRTLGSASRCTDKTRPLSGDIGAHWPTPAVSVGMEERGLMGRSAR